MRPSKRISYIVLSAMLVLIAGCSKTVVIGDREGKATALDSEEPAYIFSESWPQAPGILFNNPHNLALDPVGNLLVSTDHRIFKFSPDGDLILFWGSYGSGDGEFDGPAGIAVDASGMVYVADEGNNRIQTFTSDGIFLSKWGREGDGDGEFHGPNGLALDPSGNLYVADSYNYRIQKFTPDGRFLTKTSVAFLWRGREPNPDGDFDPPGIGAIAVDTEGNLYMADLGNRRVQKFTGAGLFLTEWGTEASRRGRFIYPQGVAVDRAGGVYVADAGSIKRFTPDGAFVAEYGERGSGYGQMDYPLGVLVDPSGRIYVCDTENDRLLLWRR